jgi:hypothetical protein
MAIAMGEGVHPVSIFHEAPLDVLREHPEAVLDLLRVAGQPAPSDIAVVMLDSELAEAVPSVRRADLVFLLRNQDLVACHAIIVEVQRDRDDEKLFAWPHYVSYLHARHRVAITLLVLTFDEDVCRWARKAHDLGPCMAFAPLVIGPTDLPTIGTIEQALANPDLAVLTALAHLGGRDAEAARRHEPEVARVFEAMLRTQRSEARHKFLSLLHGAARGPLRGILEGLTEAYGMGALEMIYKEGEAEGEARGRAEGEAKALLKILRTRGLAIDATAEARILATRDLALFDRWLERALTASSVDEVLAG